MMTIALQGMLLPGDVLMEHLSEGRFLSAFWDGQMWTRQRTLNPSEDMPFVEYDVAIPVPERGVEILRRKDIDDVSTLDYLDDEPAFPGDQEVYRLSAKFHPGWPIAGIGGEPGDRMFYIVELFMQPLVFWQVLTPALPGDEGAALVNYRDTSGRGWRRVGNTAMLNEVFSSTHEAYDFLVEMEMHPEVFQ
jgi:hypothetical protein